MIHELIQEGWLPPDQSAEVIKILNDLIRISSRDDPETNMFREQFELNEYRTLVKKVLNIESPVINRYLIRRKK